MTEELVSVNEIMEQIIENSMNAKIEGSTSSSRVLELPTAMQIAAEAYQSGMNYAFAQSHELVTNLSGSND